MKDSKLALQDKLLCYKCRKEKPLDDFAKTSHKTTARRGWQSYCRECMKEYRKTIPKETRRIQSKRGYEKATLNPARRLQRLLSTTTSNRKELDFEWAWKHLIDLDFKCEITGIPFTWDVRGPTTLSIDRIDPTLGYTKENVRFVCWWINAAMGNWGLEKLEHVIKEWYDKKQV